LRRENAYLQQRLEDKEERIQVLKSRMRQTGKHSQSTSTSSAGSIVYQSQSRAVIPSMQNAYNGPSEDEREVNVSISSTGSDIRQRLQATLNIYPRHGQLGNKQGEGNQMTQFRENRRFDKEPVQSSMTSDSSRAQSFSISPSTSSLYQSAAIVAAPAPVRSSSWMNVSEQQPATSTSVAEWVNRTPHLAALLMNHQTPPQSVGGSPIKFPPLFSNQVFSFAPTQSGVSTGVSTPVSAPVQWSIPQPVLFGLGTSYKK